MVSCSLCATLRDTARPSSMRAKILMAKRMSSMAGIASERTIADSPENPLNEAMCVEHGAMVASAKGVADFHE